MSGLPLHNQRADRDGSCARTESRDDAALISETFTSIQGEGKLTGVPSFFIRFSGCNLRCGWCDTPYASWSPEGSHASVDELVSRAKASGVRHAVLTGGEPMLFDAIGPLSRRLAAEVGMHITVETAGTIFRGPDELQCDLMSISPKLSSSTPRDDDERDPQHVWRDRHEARRINVEALSGLIGAHPQRQLKFVACRAADLAEIESLLGRLPPVPPEDVMLMPEGVTTPDPADVRWVLEAVMQRGWRYAHRLHIELFGNTRGT